MHDSSKALDIFPQTHRSTFFHFPPLVEKKTAPLNVRGGGESCVAARYTAHSNSIRRTQQLQVSQRNVAALRHGIQVGPELGGDAKIPDDSQAAHPREKSDVIIGQLPVGRNATGAVDHGLKLPQRLLQLLDKPWRVLEVVRVAAGLRQGVVANKRLSGRPGLKLVLAEETQGGAVGRGTGERLNV